MSASNTLGRGFGEKRFEVIMKECPDILTSMETNQNKITRLSNIKGMASKTAQVFVENIPRFLGFLEDCGLMSKIGDARPLPATTTNETHKLFNKSIAMSGSRDKELEVWLKTVGANISSSVSSNTFALITPDTDSVTGKVASAKKHNVKIYTPDAFRKEYVL
jgi:NAD-dependent DNA ligase